MKYKTRFAAFFSAMVLFNLAANFAHPVTPTVIKNLDLHDYMFGVALAAMLFTNFLMSPFWGKINNYVSSRMSMAVCCCGYGAAQVWFAYSSTEFQIILARMFAGLFTGGVFVSFLTYVVNKSAPEDQGKYLTITATIQSVASAFGYMIGGFLGEISVLTAFMVQAVTLAATGILFFLICEPDGEAGLSGISPGQLIKEANPFQAFMDSRTFMTVSFGLLFAVNVLINFGNTGFDQAFNYYLKDVMGLTSSYNGIIKAAVGFISFISNMTLCIWIISKTDVKKSMVSLTAVCACSALGTVISGDAGFFMGFSVVVYAGYSVSVPVLQSMIANQADMRQKNLVMGFFNATKSLGSIAGSMTAGFIYSVHVRLPFVCTFVIYGLSMAVAVAYVLGSGRKKAGST
ncbi:MAG: MFS transporter [Hungatella sp.]|jgi:DHA1 family multidrug resistance protein-like MFS transporter|nr:MFS transporter [Hungatella sp.]